MRFFCIYLGLGFSILSGGLTLACMVLPVLIRTIEEGLRTAPNDYRLATAALGLSRRAALVHLLLPAATPALIAGFMLGIGGGRRRNRCADFYQWLCGSDAGFTV